MNNKVGRTEFLKLIEGKVSAKELNLVEDAYTLAKYGHRGQSRDQGGRYFEHPKSVALIIICELGLVNADLIILALLHDVVEDTFVLSNSGLEKLFGQATVNRLKTLTNPGDKTKYLSQLAGCLDTDTLIVKFSDRLHNLRTMDGVRPEKKIKKVKETKEHYLTILSSATKHSRGQNRTALKYLRSQIEPLLK